MPTKQKNTKLDSTTKDHRAKPEDLGSGLAKRAAVLLRDKRKQQMKELGI